MMKKTLAICLGLALILTLCGTFADALASEVENGIDAIEDAMMKGNTNTSSFFDGMDDLRLKMWSLPPRYAATVWMRLLRWMK